MSKEKQMELAAKHGPVYRMWCTVRSAWVILVSDPDIMYQICNKVGNMYRDPCKFGRSPMFAKLVQDTMGASLTGMTGEEWRWRKEALLRQFVKARLLAPETGLLEAIVSEGERLCATLGRAADEGNTIRVDEVTTHAATAAILHLMFGRRPEFDENLLRESSKGLMQVLFAKLNPLLSAEEHRKAEVKKRECHDVFDRVARNELEQIVNEIKTGVRSSDRKPCMMESLFRSEPRFLEGGMERMLADARVLVNAGYETTGHAIAFALGMLAEPANAGVAERAREAATSAVAGGLSREGFWDKTAYLDKVFHEALRLFPLVLALPGTAYDDFEVEVGAKSYIVPKGSSVQFQAWAGQMSGRAWLLPDRCDPDRWNGEGGSNNKLMTFNLGAHSCPGKNLSLLEGRVFLAMILSKFRFELPPGVEKVEGYNEILFRPQDRMPLRVSRIG